MSSPITRYAVGLAAVALLGACSSGSAATPSTAGPSGASSSRVTSGTAATTRPAVSAPATAAYPTDVPAPAQANTPAGALAFTRYFFGRLNTAYATGQTGLLRPLAMAKCTLCGTLEDEVAALTLEGRHTVSEPLLLREVTSSNEPHIEGQTLIDVLFRLRATKIVDAAGAAAGTVKEVNGIYLVALVHDGTRWRVARIDVMQ